MALDFEAKHCLESDSRPGMRQRHEGVASILPYGAWTTLPRAARRTGGIYGAHTHTHRHHARTISAGVPGASRNSLWGGALLCSWSKNTAFPHGFSPPPISLDMANALNRPQVAPLKSREVALVATDGGCVKVGAGPPGRVEGSLAPHPHTPIGPAHGAARGGERLHLGCRSGDLPDLPARW